ncbi:alcohol acetyltransferase [Coniochaeta sp. 2T2.1]|nr:alcohol acetyltransferase [Coniochaeta sp. 2T2.1]
MGSIDPKIARPVGVLESYSTSRHNLGFYRCVCQTARYNVSLPLDSSDFMSVIEQAVAQAILSHPVLQAGIIDENTRSPSWVYLPHLDLSQLIRWEYLDASTSSDRDAALQRVLEARHSTLWPDLHRRPGYEFIILAPKTTKISGLEALRVDIVFAVHHAYADGNSCLILHRTLHQALNNPLAVPSFDPLSHILTITTNTPLPPPQEALIDFKLSWPFFIKTLWTEFAPSFLKPTSPTSAWAGKPISLHPDNNTRLRLVSFPAPVAADILTHCRARTPTLTPLLHVLILHSLARRLPVEAIINHSLTSNTPISLRRLLPPGGKMGFDPDTSMGVILAGQDHRFPPSTVSQIRNVSQSPSDEVIFSLTASVSDELRHKVSTLPKDDITALMPWVKDYNAWFRQKLGRGRETTWEVSNVGAADFGRRTDGEEKEGEGWKVDRLVFSQSGAVAGPAFAASVAGVKAGELTVTFSWQEGIADEGLVEGVEEDLREWLTGFARTGRFGDAA